MENGRPVIAFTNGKGEPKKLDVNRCIEDFGPSGDMDSNFSSNRDKNDFLFACPRTPLAPIIFDFQYDQNISGSNFSNGKGFQFAYQSVYMDGSVSSISPYSNLAVPPAILALGSKTLGESVVENVCVLSIPVQGSEVDFVKLIYREGNDGVPFVFDKISTDTSSFNSNFTYTGSPFLGVYSFRNDVTGVVLGETDRFKTFDNVPREPSAQAVADDRLMYGNYKEGYSNIVTDVEVDIVYDDAPPPGYTFNVAANPILLREVQDGINGNGVCVTNSGFNLDFSGVPSEVLPGDYSITVNVSPVQNIHAWYGSGDISWTPENIPPTWPGAISGTGQSNVSGLREFSDQNGSVVGAESTYRRRTFDLGQISTNISGESLSKLHNQTIDGNSSYNPGGVAPLWESSSGAVGLETGYTHCAPLIFKGRTMQFRAGLRVDSAVPKDVFEDSIAHILYGLPFETCPIVTQGSGSVSFPSTQLEATFTEVDINLNLNDQDEFSHEGSSFSELICKAHRGGFYIVNKAKLRFFLETAKNCTNIQDNGKTGNFLKDADPTEIEVNGTPLFFGQAKNGYAFKVCLAHAVDVETLTCIPLPEYNWGSYVDPALVENDAYQSLEAVFSGSASGNLLPAQRYLSAATSRWDYYFNTSGDRVIQWPDQKIQFSLGAAGMFGPAAIDNSEDIEFLDSNGNPSGYIRKGVQDSALPSEYVQDSSGNFNNIYCPAPILKWVVFDSESQTPISSRFSDNDWADLYGFKVAYDYSSIFFSASDVTIKGNPSQMFGDISQRWVGHVKNATFVNGDQNYFALGMNRGYNVRSGVNTITDLLSNEINKTSCADGSIGPGGLNGYAMKMFNDRTEEYGVWNNMRYLSTYSPPGVPTTSLASYSMAPPSRSLKSGNTVGSVTNFSLIGYVDNMPYVTHNEVLARKFVDGGSGTDIDSQPPYDTVASAQIAYPEIRKPFVSADIRGWQRLSVLDIQNDQNDGFNQPALISFSAGLATQNFLGANDTNDTESDPSIDPNDPIGSGSGVVYYADSDYVPATFNGQGSYTARDFPVKFVRVDAPAGYGGSFTTPIVGVSSSSNSTGGESFKTGAVHEFGIVYFDERGRHGAVQPIDSAFVPGYSIVERSVNEFGPAYVKIKINHAPPFWAKSYKIVYGGNNTISEFVQYSTPGAFVSKSQESNQARIYVSLNYLQSSEASYAEAYGAISQDDGTKSLYRFAPGDSLRVISYSSTGGQVFYPNDNYEFRILGTETLDPDMTNHPLFDGENEEGPDDIGRSGEFLVLENNPNAIGFNVTDIAAGLSKWGNRVIFEIFRPRKELGETARPYYETNYGGQVLANGDHQYNEITITKGDVYYRQVPVGSNIVDSDTGQFVSTIRGSVDDPSVSTNFVTYFLETEGFTDLYKSDSKSYGRIHFVDPNASEVERESSISFSEKTFTGSLDMNYFSFPQLGNFKDLPVQNGGIQRMISDNVLLHAYQDSRVSYLPIARDVLQTGGESAIVTSSKILGTATEVPIKSSIHDHGESVIVIEGDHYYFDPQLEKVMMLKDGKTPITISDYGVDSYIKERVRSWKQGGAYKAVLGHDPDNNELVFCILNKDDLHKPITTIQEEDKSKGLSESYPLMGVLAFDLSTKKRWKTRYSYLSQIFSRLGNNLVSFWGSSTQTIPWIHNDQAPKNRFFGEAQADTSFVCVSNAGTETVKEFVMLNAVSDRFVDAKIKTDQQDDYTSKFRIWKDYDGIKYSEVPKSNSKIEESRINQKLKFAPTYPNTSGSIDPEVVIKDIPGMGLQVIVSAKIPLNSSFWRSPIPVGPKTFLVERKFNEQEVYPIGSHPDSDYIFDRKATVYKLSSSADDGMGVVQIAMPLERFYLQFNQSEWIGETSANAVPTEAFSAMQLIEEKFVTFDVQAVEINFLTNILGATINESQTDDTLSDEQILALTRLFVMPIVSGIGIAASSAPAVAQSIYVNGSAATDYNPAADFNEDGTVTVNDLLILLTGFGNEGAIGDIDNDGFVTTADLLAFLSSFGGSEIALGCTDPNALNYDPDAELNDGSCEYPNPDDENNDGGGGVDEEDDENDGGGGTNGIDIWNAATGSPNASIYIGYDGQIDGSYTKGKHMSIEITANPAQGGSELNLESLLVDHNTAVKKSMSPTPRTRTRKK